MLTHALGDWRAAPRPIERESLGLLAGPGSLRTFPFPSDSVGRKVCDSRRIRIALLPCDWRVGQLGNEPYGSLLSGRHVSWTTSERCSGCRFACSTNNQIRVCNQSQDCEGDEYQCAANAFRPGRRCDRIRAQMSERGTSRRFQRLTISVTIGGELG